jgi:hypothetical protein
LARCFVLTVGLLLAANVRVDGQTASAVIDGTITDPQGAVLPGVTVTVRSLETGIVRTTVSQEEGRHRVPALPPGQYDLIAELPGFQLLRLRGLRLP